jgi:hypothetical protein
MFIKSFFFIAALAGLGYAAPVEKRQAPEGVPDYVIKYGTYLLVQFPPPSFFIFQF